MSKETSLEEAIAKTFDVLPASWMVLVADCDGTIITGTSTGLTAWQARGILEWARDTYISQPMWTYVEDEDFYGDYDE